MNFRSVKGESPEVSFNEALFSGLAPDGSLYVPESFPKLSPQFLERTDLTLHTIGAEIASLFIDEIPRSEMLSIVERAWDFSIPVVKLDENLFLLELFHGPTLAFKDVGARFMAGVMSYFLSRDKRNVSILVATSGDTGSAVANGFYNTPNVSVFVLYPSGQVSALQERQMTTLGGNIHALEVEGTFDDCQRLVKGAFSDQEIVSRCGLTTANSINIARLLPQAAYYLWAVYQLRQNVGFADAEPLVVVPSGNFGNLTAAVYARAVGTRVAGFLAATNANDVVPQYFSSGRFVPRPSLRTFSNAMDVGDPSNLARLESFFGNELYAMRKEISAVSITDDQTLAEIRRTYDRFGYIADPHTAVGLSAYNNLSDAVKAARPAIIASTAHPAKFGGVIHRALGIDVPLPPALSQIVQKQKLSTPIKADQGDLRKILLTEAG